MSPAELTSLLRLHLTERGVLKEDSKVPERIRVDDGLLILPGDRPVQDAAEEFLEQFRANWGQRFLIECLLVAPAVMAEVAPDWPARAPRLSREDADKVLADTRSRFLSCTAEARRWTTAGVKTGKAVLSDYEVNQTGVIPVTNPVVDVPVGGDWLQACVYPMAGSDRIWLELKLGRFQHAVTTATLGTDWADLDLPATRETLVSMSSILDEGVWWVAASLGGDDGLMILLRLLRHESAAGGGARRKAAKSYYRLYDLSLLARDETHREWWHVDELLTGDEAPSPRVAAVAQLEAIVSDVDDAEEVRHESSPEEGWFHLWAPRHVHDKVANVVSEWLGRSAQTVTVDLQLLDLSRKDFVVLRSLMDDQSCLQRGWEKALEGGEKDWRQSHSLTVATGRVHALRQASIRSYVTDVDNVSGGTGFAIVELADPVTQRIGEGMEFRVQADLLVGEGRARLRIDGVESAFTEMRAAKARFPTIKMAEDMLPTRSVKELDLLLPAQKATYYRLQREVQLERSVVLQADAQEAKTVRVLIGRLRRW